MTSKSPVTVRLKDYRQPDYWIRDIQLVLRIFDSVTEVESALTIERNESVSGLPKLVLDGVEQEIKALFFDDQPIEQYQYENDQLTLQPTSANFQFKAVTHIYPNDNTSLEGLYKSGTMICTQCEAEGFRKITFYQDRPDVMATFTTRIEANSTQFPVLLSNGNPIDSGTLDAERHYAVWQDPFPKPAYLFAAVAGDLVRKDDVFTTCSGREISLRIFAEPHNAHKTDFALESLKRSMTWDEQRFGREYDLDIFMIVASDFFNMGAMENKGLNIFNSAAVLASSETSNDARFERIEGIVAHEYFHNWSGNRVTCRDWFQLSLKEGFTVYRDAEFTADHHDRAVKRIKDVTFLKTFQFPEDSGPNAHPVQPQEYMEINNFYTVTIYEKGAEVVGMLNTLIGDDLFRQGSDLYFERFDGMAVTTDDFVACMEAVSGQDFTQFKRWYTQSGTPDVSVQEAYDEPTKTYRLTFSQHCKPTPGQVEKAPYVIPVRMALLNGRGEEQAIICDGQYRDQTSVLTLTDAVTTVTFRQLDEKPIASLFRDFSAPVRVNFAQSDDDLIVLATQDPNAFNRFNAVQTVYLDTLVKLTLGTLTSVPSLVDAVVESVLDDERLSHAMKASLLTLPSYQMLVDQLNDIHVDALVAARETLYCHIAQQYAAQWQSLTQQLASAEPYVFNSTEAGRRELQGLSLCYWASNHTKAALDFAEALYRSAINQTDRLNGLKAVLESSDERRKDVLLSNYYHNWQSDTQMVETWFLAQSSSAGVTLEAIERLLTHSAFDIKNPNKVRSVLGGFAANFKAFHDADGAGYAFFASKIAELDALNPQIAARFVTAIENWRKFEPKRSLLIKRALESLLVQKALSPDVTEKVQKALA